MILFVLTILLMALLAHADRPAVLVEAYYRHTLPRSQAGMRPIPPPLHY